MVATAVNPLHPHPGAELRGVEPREPAPKDALREIEALEAMDAARPGRGSWSAIRQNLVRLARELGLHAGGA